MFVCSKVRAVPRVGMFAALMLLITSAFTSPHALAHDGDLIGHDGQGCFLPSGALKATIALDPGHGAADPGAQNTVEGVTLYERDLVLDIAGRTKDILVSAGYKVCLTRTTNHTNPSNTQRAQYANSKAAKLFVLIHLNGSSNPATNYTQTFWGKKSKDLNFSTHMYNALFNTLGIPGNGVGQFASGALLKSNMPATLTESVFLTNDAEAAKLVDTSTSETSRRQQIAQALAAGIRSYR